MVFIILFAGRCICGGTRGVLVIGEAVVEKNRVELSRSYSDMLQTSLALKGDWNLVLANIAREEQAQKKNDSNILETRPTSKMRNSNGPVNANGSKRSKFYKAIEARKVSRINKLGHFLLLENETIAGFKRNPNNASRI